MGGIRKKTSKRSTTRQKVKIGKNAAEQRRKDRKAAKKDVTWKSKKNKDPGIPNNFPYKDQVLAEIADQKRQAQEAKDAKRAASKEEAALLKGKGRAQADDEESDDENPGIITFHNKVAVNLPSAARAAAAPREAAASPPPALVDNLLPTPQAALDRADVVIEVVDARDPHSFRSGFLENVVREGQTGSSKAWKDKLLVVLNKADLVPRESAEAWVQALRKELGAGEHVEVCLAYSTAAGKARVQEILSAWADAKSKMTKGSGEKTLVASVMGSPNVGKSSLINALLGQQARPTAPVSSSAASGKAPQPTTLTCVETQIPESVVGQRQIALIDTPGWEFNAPEESDDEEDEEDEDEEAQAAKFDALEKMVAKDILTRNLGRVDKIKDPLPLVKWIVERASPQDLTLAYNVPYFMKGDVQGFLVSLARTNGRVRKHGDADVNAAARIVLRDWSESSFPYYTMPGKSALEGAAAVAEDEVLSTLRSLKDIKKEGKGIVKLTSGGLDGRELILDEEYEQDESESDSEDAFESAQDLDVDEMADEDDEQWDGSGEEVEFSQDEEPSDDSEDDEEEEELPPAKKATAGKRKRLSEPGGGAPPIAKRSKKAVTWLAGDVEEPAFDERKVGASAKLKRKADEDEGSNRKKSKAELGSAAIEEETRSIKSAPVKKAKQPKEKSQVKAPVAPVKTAKAKVAKADDGAEKPYDFGAHFF